MCCLRSPELSVCAMGICFSKPDALANDRRLSFSQDESLYIRKSAEIKLKYNGSTEGFDSKEQKQRVDSKDQDFLKGSPKLSPVCSVCGSDRFDSSKMSSEEVSVEGHPQLQLLNPKLGSMRMSPFSKSCRVSSSNSEWRVDHESPRSKFKGLLVNHLVKSLSLRRSISSSSRSVEINSSEPDIYNPISICNIPKNTDNMQSEEDHAKSLPPAWNADIYSITATRSNKTSPLLSDDKTTRADEADLPATKFNGLGSCARKESESQSSGRRRSYRSSLVEGEKAFGSPFCVDSSNLCDGRKDKIKGRSSIDEWSDSSCDLFDLDFRKAERVATGMAFPLE